MKKLRTGFINSPLMVKLLFMFTAAAVIPITIITLFSYSRTERQLVDVAYNNMNASNQQINANVDAQLDIFRHVSSNLYTDDGLRDYLIQDYTRDYDFVEAYRYINNRLYSLLAANGNIAQIRIYVYNESIPSDGLFIGHTDEDNTPSGFLLALEKSYGNDLFSDILKDAKGNDCFLLGRILNYNSQAQPYGLLTIAIREDLLYTLIEKEDAIKDVFLLNAENKVMSARDKKLLNQDITEAVGLTLPADRSGSEMVELEGQKSLAVYNTMQNGWKTVSIIPYQDIVADARKTSGQIIIIALFSILFSSMMVVMISQYLSRRLKALIFQAYKVTATSRPK